MPDTSSSIMHQSRFIIMMKNIQHLTTITQDQIKIIISDKPTIKIQQDRLLLL
jgi:hypothetical protein